MNTEILLEKKSARESIMVYMVRNEVDFHRSMTCSKETHVSVAMGRDMVNLK